MPVRIGSSANASLAAAGKCKVAGSRGTIRSRRRSIRASMSHHDAVATRTVQAYSASMINVTAAHEDKVPERGGM
ncbi:MAG: hypothetical protein KGL35_18495 [Bradyrhizobium sp.]|nr:hypothetical protein [Pseudomonadota bacterium]MDE2470672.1 hypothetical protein [Bradyrhizobium sp.]